MSWSYHFCQLERGVPARRALVEHLAANPPKGGRIVGFFVPQLGWEAAEAAFLVHWDGEAGDLAAPQIRSAERHLLSPTLRPQGAPAIDEGGIHVHRWFETSAADLDTFISLSGEGWKDFEPRFEAKVFGLFLADESDADRAAGSRRLLLITRYGDHGIWEQSRDPSSAAMQTFGKRQQLTRRTSAASTLLVPIR